MKSQVAAEAVAGAELARGGWRPANGALKLVFVSDEETGGELGAQWLTREHPDLVRCDMLLNEGGGMAFEYDGRRRYGVCCGEKGVFRFTITAPGIAGHASMPKTGDNALLKLGPVLDRLAAAQSSFELTDVAVALIARLGGDPEDPAAALARIASTDPALPIIVEPMLGRDAHADDGARVRQGERDPLARADQGRLPGPAGTRRGRGAPADRPGAGRRRRRDGDRFHRDGGRQPVAARVADDGRDRAVARRRRPRGRGGPGAAARILRLEVVPRRVPRLRRVRVLPAAAP